MINRRNVLKVFVGVPTAFSMNHIYQNWELNNVPISLKYPGLINGHLIRDKKIIEKSSSKNNETDILIVGSGISALTACWKLIQLKYKGKITLVTGDELFGNSSDTKINNNFYPTGAHYLPLQNQESIHTRELLKFFNIIKKDEFSEYPTYNDEYLVYSPMERVLLDNKWNDGVYHKTNITNKFFNTIKKYKNKIGKDNNKLFAIPLELSSYEEKNLDLISFKEWLINNNFVDEELWNHLNYCCKDDYGINIDQTSAWAGIHYFSGRTGKCKNTKAETILTWENGNAFLAKTIFNYIKDKITIINGSAFNIDKKDNFNISILEHNKNITNINAKKLLIATPLHIVNYLFNKKIFNENIIPEHSVWLVSNFVFKDLPKEKYTGIQLSYDNVIANSTSLGFVFTHNQSLDISIENKVLTTYVCLSDQSMKSSRKQVLKMSKEEILKLASKDLITAYGHNFYSLLSSVEITIRGHAMPFPNVGFLTRNQSLKLKTNELEKENLFFAHSDLSGISIFEEASWQGYCVAKKML